MDIIDRIDLMISEALTLPIEKGDVVYGGRFKNKAIKVQTIEWNEKGDLLINGKGAMKIRIPKVAKGKEEDEKGEGVQEPEEIKHISTGASY